MNADDFETRLQRQEWRRVPADWREEILNAAREATSLDSETRLPPRSWLSILHQQLSTFLWPSPKAWGALAGVWVLVFAVGFSMRDKPATTARRTSAPSPAMLVQLEQQKRLLAELIGWLPAADTDRPRPSSPRPHSERREEFLTI